MSTHLTKPVHQWPEWVQQVHADGYRAAMTGRPFEPNAMIEWQMGFRVWTSQKATSPATNAQPIPSNTALTTASTARSAEA